jgi:hypothetical protein
VRDQIRAFDPANLSKALDFLKIANPLSRSQLTDSLARLRTELQ